MNGGLLSSGELYTDKYTAEQRKYLKKTILVVIENELLNQNSIQGQEKIQKIGRKPNQYYSKWSAVLTSLRLYDHFLFQC